MGRCFPAPQLPVMPMNILHLTLKKKWFDLIASGEKQHEFRECKPYWEKRLLHGPDGIPNEYDEIHFRKKRKGVKSMVDPFSKLIRVKGRLDPFF